MTKIIFPSRYSALSLLNRHLKSPKYQGCKFIILIDENTYNNCLPLLISQVSALEEAEFVEVPIGEEAKSIEIASQVISSLLESTPGLGRNNVVLINLGGGCVSDLGGFIASVFRRGIRYINVPTTLVSMIDAAIGGKSGLNHDGIKNAIGVINQPETICIEPSFLDTLPSAEMKNGLFEMLKTFILSNPDNYEALHNSVVHNEILLSDSLIQECVSFKHSVVKADPNEHGIRKILNFGHTFGHAIESYCALPHGEAVGIGMVCALYLSVKKLGLEKSVLASYLKAIKSYIKIPSFNLKDVESILELIKQDKKNSEGLILCVLLQEIGSPVIDVAIDENEIRDTLLNLKKL